MKYLFIILMFCTKITIAQQQLTAENDESIARIEMAAHQNAHTLTTLARTYASTNIDVKYYKCDWEVDPAIRFINGKVTIYFKTLESLSTITLDLMSQLGVDSIKRNNTNLLYSQTAMTLDIIFPAVINNNTLDSVTIWYKGIPPTTGFGSFILSSHMGTPVMWTLSEPYGSRDWWPCKNGTEDKADSLDVFITHPSIYSAASNGLLQSEVNIGGGKTKTHWKHKYAISSYLVCMAVTNYVTFNNSVQLGNINLPMLTYCYPESQVSFQDNTYKVLEAMQLFHNNFGPYPFINEKYGHVQFGFGGGQEHQTSTFIVSTNESLMAHELGHQWFGDKITCRSFQDIWLNEGFATYLAAFHMETKYPANALVNRRSVLNNITGAIGGSVKVIDTVSVSNIFSGRLSYNKGSYLLFMLRYILGDDVFHKAIRRYQNNPQLAYGTATTADLKRNIEAESGKDFTNFFKQWFEGEGYPSYKVKWNVLDSNCANINLSQTVSMPNVTPFFKMPVTLLFKNATQQKKIVVDNTINNETFVRNIGFKADTVLVDPELWIISKNNNTEKTADVNNNTCGSLTNPLVLANTGLGAVEVLPNPTTNPFEIYLHDFTDTKAELIIYNSAGQRIFTNTTTLTNGTARQNVKTNNWAKGNYVLAVKSGGITIIKQIIK
jgi:aminopeptidase N